MKGEDRSGRGMDWAALREALARKYPTVEEARQFVLDVGLDPIRIEFRNRADLTWFNILEEARKQGDVWVRKVLDLAIRHFPDDEALKRIRDGDALRYAEGPDMKSLGWRGRGGQTYERVISVQSALVSVSFLEIGIRRARAVVRIKCEDGAVSTGFLLPGDLLVTNNHVLSTKESAATATAQFNYQKTADGLDTEPHDLALDPEAFFVTSEKDDYTIVKVTGEPSMRWGSIELAPVSVRVGDRVNIIQHPGGEQKQLSFFHNLVEYVGEGRVQYLTDTLPGSSGAPVFDKEWRLVALHHSGGWIPEPGSKDKFFRNEGIHVDRLIEALRGAR